MKIEGVNFVFSTLWSHISEHNRWKVQQSVSDFHVIKNSGRNLTVPEFNELHESSLAFLKKALTQAKGEKQVVITHHVPTLLNYPEQYKNSPINEAFAVELFDFISGFNADYWIYGHHHCNTPSFKIGQTQMLTNQLGYVQLNEHGLFQRDACFEI